MAFNLTLLLCDNMLVSSSTLAAEIFNFAQAMAKANRNSTQEVIIRRVSADGLPVQTSSGFELTPTHNLNNVFPSDLIHVPALWRNPRPVVRKHHQYIPGSNNNISKIALSLQWAPASVSSPKLVY